MFLFDMVILHCYINLGDCWIVKGYPGVNIQKDVGKNHGFPREMIYKWWVFHACISLQEGNLGLTISVVSGFNSCQKYQYVEPNSISKPSVNVGTPKWMVYNALYWTILLKWTIWGTSISINIYMLALADDQLLCPQKNQLIFAYPADNVGSIQISAVIFFGKSPAKLEIGAKNSGTSPLQSEKHVLHKDGIWSYSVPSKKTIPDDIFLSRVSKPIPFRKVGCSTLSSCKPRQILDRILLHQNCNKVIASIPFTNRLNPIYSNNDCESWLVTLYFWLNYVKSPFCMFLFVPLFAQTYRSPKPRFCHQTQHFLSWLIYTNWVLALPKASFNLANPFPQYWIATPI